MTKVLLKSNALSTLWIQICDSCEEFFDPENCIFLVIYRLLANDIRIQDSSDYRQTVLSLIQTAPNPPR